MEIKGIIPAMLTPFDENQKVNEAAAKQLIDRLIEKGVDGLFILGTNGEFHVMTFDEKVAYAKCVVDYVNKRVPVYVGAGACGTQETIDLAKAMEAVGADALSVISPYFIAPKQAELKEHYRLIAEAVSLPVILYNIPGNTGINIDPEIVRELAKIPNIKAIKDSSGKMDNLQAYIDAGAGQDFAVLVGSDSKILPALKLGATGAVAGTANVITEHDIALYQAFLDNRLEEAEKLQTDIDVLRAVLKLGTVPSVMKRAVTLLGIDMGDARRPAGPLGTAHDDAILDALKFYHLV